MFSKIVFDILDEFLCAYDRDEMFMVSESVQNERLNVCKGCEYYDAEHSGCKECGCYLPTKIKDPFNRCPIDKWISNDEKWLKEDYDKLIERLVKFNPEYLEEIKKYEQC